MRSGKNTPSQTDLSSGKSKVSPGAVSRTRLRAMLMAAPSSLSLSVPARSQKSNSGAVFGSYASQDSGLGGPTRLKVIVES